MTNNPSFSFDLYPGLDAELDAAYERNISNGVADPDIVATAGLNAVVGQALANHDPTSNPNLSPDFQTVVADAHRAAKNVLDAIEPGYLDDLSDPVFEAIDWKMLDAAYQTMEANGMEPQVVISPGHLSVAAAEMLFDKLPNTRDGGLYIDSSVKQHQEQVDLNPQIDKRWNVSVIAATERPTITNISHDVTNVDSQAESLLDDLSMTLGIGNPDATRASYPTFSEYLMLQAMRLNTGRSPIDSDTYTWLQGTFDNNTKAPFAYWNPVVGQVRVFWYDPDDQDGLLGVRPAVRG